MRALHQDGFAGGLRRTASQEGLRQEGFASKNEYSDPAERLPATAFLRSLPGEAFFRMHVPGTYIPFAASRSLMNGAERCREDSHKLPRCVVSKALFEKLPVDEKYLRHSSMDNRELTFDIRK